MSGEESNEYLKTPEKLQQKPKRHFTVPSSRVAQKQKKAISNVLPLADEQEEIGSSD